jgi:peptide/nickel transport system permease protein
MRPLFNFRRSDALFWQKFGFAASVFYLLVVLVLVVFASWLPLPFQPNELDLGNPYLEPAFTDPGSARTGHWLGTDALGRDVLATVIFGFRTGFLIALPVMLVSALIGISLGSLAGFYGNYGLKLTRAALVASISGLFLALFYVFYLRFYSWQQALNTGFEKVALELLISAGWLAGIVILCFLLSRLLKTLAFFRKKVKLPFDEFLLKTIELLTTVPRLILILCLAAVINPGMGSLFFLLCLTFWTGIARLARTEIMKIKNLAYVEAAQVSGLPDHRIIVYHILPNAAGSLITAFSFGLGSLLGLESGLSFLGIGLPPETPSWGRLLAGLRLNPEAWWLLVFPALALWLTILAIQTCGNQLQKSYTIK